MSVYRENAAAPSVEDDSDVLQFKSDDERAFWRAAWAAVASASDCKSPATAATWADKAVRAIRSRSYELDRKTGR